MSGRSLVAVTTAGALIAGFLIPATASADTQPQTTDRARVVMLWQVSGQLVRSAAEQALVGSDADVHTFLTSGYQHAAELDERITVDHMLANGGVATKTAAQQALDATDPGAIRQFLDSGWNTPHQTDLRVKVDQRLAEGGSETRKAAQQALDAGTVDALQQFLATGWRAPWQADQRIRINQILAGGGSEVRKSAQVALDAGTLDAYVQFLDQDLLVAQTRDQETQTVAQLASVAQDAGDEAARETTAALDAAHRAAVETELARQAAVAAADAAQKAHGDANVAAAAANTAADAANRAAAAAREAIGAANSASSAARVAASAAARAATAASKAGEAAATAEDAATAAVGDETRAPDARQAAEKARDVAAGAQAAANAAQAAGDAAQHASDAAGAARDAGNQAAAAAKAATDAGNFAHDAGADASQAVAAAAEASNQAARATRAANAAQNFAHVAAAAAYASRDAANRAAADALAAAAAADSAADHAGHATDAAAEATQHANAASDAAARATTAATQASNIYDAARQADAERIAVMTEDADNAAMKAKAAAGSTPYTTDWGSTQQARRDAETTRLITEATANGTSDAVAVADGRKIALRLAQNGGPWSQAAAIAALSGADGEVLAYVRGGIDVAAGQDDRITLQNVADVGTDGLQKAVATTLKGTDSDVRALLVSRDYPNRSLDDRLAVNRVLAAAQSAGGPAVQQAAQKALDAGTEAAYNAFLTQGQYVAASQDQRIAVGRILSDPASGAETKGMAQAALDGTDGTLRQFLESGQYLAERHDQEAASHDAEVAGYLKQAAQAAATANQNANDAQAAAYTARGLAAKAAEYAAAAKASATDATNAAKDAHDSAVRAQQSAAAAAASASTAKQAATRAQNDAHQAAKSALWAESSASQAAGYANTAYEAWRVAYWAAVQTGADAAAAATAAKQAADKAITQINDERAQQAYRLSNYCEVTNVGDKAAYNDCMHFAASSPEERIQIIANRGVFCSNIFQQGTPYFENCIHETLDPAFAADESAGLVSQLMTEISTLEVGIGIMLVSLRCMMSNLCGMAVAYTSPDMAALIPWMQLSYSLMGGGMVGAALTTNAIDVFEEGWLANEALSASVAAEARAALQASEADRLTRLGQDPANGWKFNQEEYDMAIAIEKKFGVQLIRWPNAQGPDWISLGGRTFDGIGPLKSQFFDKQWDLGNIQNQIAKHVLGKADMVPVALGDLTPEQAAKVRDFIVPFQPYVFILE